MGLQKDVCVFLGMLHACTKPHMYISASLTLQICEDVLASDVTMVTCLVALMKFDFIFYGLSFGNVAALLEIKFLL